MPLYIDNQSFNPCFNGYYTYTGLVYSSPFLTNICFNPCFNGYYTYTHNIHKQILHAS